MNTLTSYLKSRGISPEVASEFGLMVADHHQLGKCIQIPVLDENGNFVFNKYRRSPMSQEGPKYIYDKGGSVQLYGWHLAKKSKTILLLEGEFDCLVAWSNKIPAVSSTGGAMSFRPEWAEMLADKKVVICYDNDEAGAKGMVRILSQLPNAYVVFIPDKPNVKDITDYVANGGDIRELLKTARQYKTVAEVQDDRAVRLATWQSVFFHDAFIAQKLSEARRVEVGDRQGGDDILKAKQYPIQNLVKFNSQNKACCLWHEEKTPSMHYYQDTNTVHCFGCGKTADAIDVYRAKHNCTFKEAVKKLK